jgi:hypothetical protein
MVLKTNDLTKFQVKIHLFVLFINTMLTVKYLV